MADHQQAPHPAVAHHKAAADHLRRAANDLDRANVRHETGEHATAAEVSKQAVGHVQEASKHLAQAQHLHLEAEHERQAGDRRQATGDSGSHGASKDKGSHVNANDPGDDERAHYGTNADDGEPYAR